MNSNARERVSDASAASSTSSLTKDFFFQTNYFFGKEEYSCTLQTRNQNTLLIEVELLTTLDRWRGTFLPNDIELLTSRTGNLKSFPVFIKMLYTALTNKSESVKLDFMTKSQLELSFNKGNSSNKESKPTNTRFFVLTYHVEFDCIGYPLPLAHVPPTVDRLQEIIANLRAENGKLKTNPENSKLLKEEIDKLRTKIRELQQVGEFNSPSSEMNKLRQEIEKLRQEKQKLQQANEILRKDHGNEIRIMDRECKHLAADLESKALEIETLKRKLEATTTNKIEESTAIKHLKKQIKGMHERLLEQDTLLQKREFEYSKLKKDFDQLKRDSQKPQQKLVTAAPRRLPASNERTQAKVTNNTQRSRSPSPAPATKRSTSAPSRPFKRFDPTEYVKKKTPSPSSSRKTSPVTKSNSGRTSPVTDRRDRSASSSRSSSVERKSNIPSGKPPRPVKQDSRRSSGPALDPETIRRELKRLNELNKKVEMQKRMGNRHIYSSTENSDADDPNSDEDDSRYRKGIERVVVSRKKKLDKKNVYSSDDESIIRNIRGRKSILDSFTEDDND